MTILQATIFTIMVVATISFDLPVGEAATTILIGRTILMIVFGAVAFSTEVSFSETRPLRLLPQTQLILWGIGLLAIWLSTNGWRWLEPTLGAWIFMIILLTSMLHKGLVWLWQQLTTKLDGNQT